MTRLILTTGLAVLFLGGVVSQGWAEDHTVIETGAQRLKSGNHDCLIGFGGGSPSDTAKAMAILATGGGRMRERSGWKGLSPGRRNSWPYSSSSPSGPSGPASSSAR